MSEFDTMYCYFESLSELQDMHNLAVQVDCMYALNFDPYNREWYVRLDSPDPRKQWVGKGHTELDAALEMASKQLVKWLEELD